LTTTDASAFFLISLHYKPPRPNSNYKKERFYYKMAASKPTFHSSFWGVTFYVKNRFWALSIGLGCFPLDKRPYHLLSDFFFISIFGVFLNSVELSHPPSLKRTLPWNFAKNKQYFSGRFLFYCYSFLLKKRQCIFIKNVNTRFFIMDPFIRATYTNKTAPVN